MSITSRSRSLIMSTNVLKEVSDANIELRFERLKSVFMTFSFNGFYHLLMQRYIVNVPTCGTSKKMMKK